MNTELTLESLYELVTEKLSLHEVFCTRYPYGIWSTNKSLGFELSHPRTSWKLKVVNDYDIEQRYEVSIHLHYTIEKYDKPRFKKDVYTRKK